MHDNYYPWTQEKLSSNFLNVILETIWQKLLCLCQVEPEPETPNASPNVTHMEDPSRNFGMSPIKRQPYTITRGGVTGHPMTHSPPSRPISVQDRIRQLNASRYRWAKSSTSSSLSTLNFRAHGQGQRLSEARHAHYCFADCFAVSLKWDQLHNSEQLF